jgi:16S rRNA (cytosine1402-N4)-methyltransferase
MMMVSEKEIIHLPVMCKEILEQLDLRPGKIIVDATVGMGGHSIEILKRITPGGMLIGIDKDEESLELCRETLSEFKGSFELRHGDFRDIDKILSGMNISGVDGILFDLGVSSYQLGIPERGFSFRMEGPLDMRMDRTSFISAYDLVNNLNEEELSNLLWSFGQERWHNRIAHLMIQERQRSPISTTRQLSDIVVRATPHNHRHYRIHPATRTFQAIRIAVNRELETLDVAIKKAVGLLKPGGRICVIAFHSLEDRIVKLNFRAFSQEHSVKLITKKPLFTSQREKFENPASRSARLRVAERS